MISIAVRTCMFFVLLVYAAFCFQIQGFVFVHKLCPSRVPRSIIAKLRQPVLKSMDSFIVDKLDSIKSTYEALNERLGDVNIMQDRQHILLLSRRRASIQPTVEAYEQWCEYERERLSLVEMDQETGLVDSKDSASDEQDLRDMIRSELRDIAVKQTKLEKDITLLLLPQDPNDDRNVMLEVRAGTGGDEASIFAGELVGVYKKYCEQLGWRTTLVSEHAGEMGGFKSCCLQITGDFVYSKLKYEVTALVHSTLSLMVSMWYSMFVQVVMRFTILLFY